MTYTYSNINYNIGNCGPVSGSYDLIACTNIMKTGFRPHLRLANNQLSELRMGRNINNILYIKKDYYNSYKVLLIEKYKEN